jgi:hypothetical protein
VLALVRVQAVLLLLPVVQVARVQLATAAQSLLPAVRR